MWVTRLRLRDFRSYSRAEVALGPGLNVVHGHNGAGKTNLLEALYFGCTGRSCRTSNEREMVRFGAQAARVVVEAADADVSHVLTVALAPGETKRMQVDGVTVERMGQTAARPLVGVFLPERLELVKGPPALRRSHVDTLVGALWPARAGTRRSYAHALAQRNALLLRIRAGRASSSSLTAWDHELARHAIALRDQRAELASRLAPPFAERSRQLALGPNTRMHYRPRTEAASASELVAELAERQPADLERGYTGHGPHRDELALTREGRPLRAYGSQGEQRSALLALLLAERDLLREERGEPPVLLLDDVMSELDQSRRALLADELVRGGQTLVTTTDLSHVPGATSPSVSRLVVSDGTILGEALAA